MVKTLNGQEFDDELSQKLHDQLAPKPHWCFYTTVKAMEYLPKAVYVEGYAVSTKTSEPFLHAWLEVDGEIIDPSLPDGNRAYFPGGSRSREEYLENLEQVEIQKAQGPRELSEEEKRNLPQHIQEQHYNPDYHTILVKRMSIQNKKDTVTLSSFEKAQRQALEFHATLVRKLSSFQF